MVAILEKQLQIATTTPTNSSCEQVQVQLDANGSKFSLPSRRRRRVHFDTDENSSHHKSDHHRHDNVYTYEAAVQEEEDKCLVYSSLKEIREMTSAATKFAHEYMKAHPEWIDHVDSLLLKDLNDASTSSETNNEAIVTESEARGLELSCSSLWQKHQHWAIQSVLGRYQQLKPTPPFQNSIASFDMMEREDDERVDEEQAAAAAAAAELLRTRCEKVNKFTREIALKLGRGDELQARRVYAEEPSLRPWLSTTSNNESVQV